MDTLTLLGMVLKLGAVLLIIAPVLWLVKRFATPGGLQRARHIRLLETRSLGPGQVLYLLRVGEQDLLVAGSKSGLNVLTEVHGVQAESLADAAPTSGAAADRQVPALASPLAWIRARLQEAGAARARPQTVSADPVEVQR